MGEREQWVRGAAAMRAGQVRALLDGGARSTSPRQHAARLRARPLARRLRRLDARAPRVRAEGWAGAVRRDGAGRGGRRRVAGGAQRAGRTQGRPPRLLGGPARARSTSATCACCAAAPAALSVAAGTPAHGVEGFVLSHREALVARRVAQLRGEAGRLRVSYPDLALEALMVNDRGRPAASPSASSARWRRRRRDDAAPRLDPGGLPRGGRQLRPRRPPPRRPHQHRHLPRPPRRGAARPPRRPSASSSCAWRCAWRGWSGRGLSLATAQPVLQSAFYRRIARKNASLRGTVRSVMLSGLSPGRRGPAACPCWCRRRAGRGRRGRARCRPRRSSRRSGGCPRRACRRGS